MSSLQRMMLPLAVVLAFAAGAAWHISSAQEPKTKSARKWEYKFISSISENAVNDAGDAGWELVAAEWRGGTNATVLYFKRPK